jgi:hypothetical protein
VKRSLRHGSLTFTNGAIDIINDSPSRKADDGNGLPIVPQILWERQARALSKTVLLYTTKTNQDNQRLTFYNSRLSTQLAYQLHSYDSFTEPLSVNKSNISHKGNPTPQLQPVDNHYLASLTKLIY